MAAAFTDEELRKKLKSLGVDVGPITPNTRRTYERKLDHLLKSQSSGKSVLNALSSDDSEIDRSSVDDVSRRKKRINHRNHPVTPTKSKQDLSPVQDVFKKPLSTSFISKSPGRRQSHGRSHGNSSSSFEVETSDSDYDSDTLSKSPRTLQTRNHRLSGTPKQNELDSFSRLRKSFQTSTPNGGKSHSNNKYNRTENYKPITLHSDVNSIRSEKSYTKGNIVNGFAADVINQEFQNEKNRGKSTNYSHCVSWLLVLAATGLFVILGIFYISTVHKNQLISSKSHSSNSFVCPKDQKQNSPEKNCVPENYYDIVRTTVRELYDLLSAVAGEYECGSNRKTRNLTVAATKQLLEQKISSQLGTLKFDDVFKYSIFLSLKNPEWGIKVVSKSGERVESLDLERPDVISALESLESSSASKSLWCRLKHSIWWTLAKLSFMALGIAFVCLSFVGFKFWKKRKEQEEKKFYDLVEKVIDILQTSEEAGIPVIHIRDKLFPLKERRNKFKLWERVASFIEDNESRVQVGTEQIFGEEYRVWRWLPAESEAGKYGKVWQGPAFTNSNKSKNHVQYSPTPCLKIRNMFDSDMEYGDDWQTDIKDAILEKCEGNDGIIHITVDPQSNEGCVYVMCNSTKNAGKTYNALHGWWFDGKLVTVKYLRLQRYLEKFPESEGCTQPLSPSNNKRLSLSAPFFSSVLERS